MSKANELLDLAKKWIGKNEKDGTHKKIIDIYNAHKPLARGYKVKYNDNWCATFVSACAIEAGLTNIIPLECSCGRMIELAKQMNIWNENGAITPKIGDIIMYDWDRKDGWADHVGIVESVSNNQITVIEGNKNNAVSRRTITAGNASIRGYIQPNYNDTPSSQPQPSTPPKQNNSSNINSIIALGQQHSINFTAHSIAVDGICGTNTMKNGIRCVQHAMNLDYRAGLNVDGIWGVNSNKALGKHYVKKGEKQYMVTALEILLMLNGYDAGGVECAGIFGSGLQNAVKKFQSDNGLTVDGIAGNNTFKKLMGVY